MGVCCGTAKRAANVKVVDTKDHVAVTNGFQAASSTATSFQPIAFDVVVPDGTAVIASPPKSAVMKNGESNNLSGTLFNASMHTLGDASINIDRSGASYDLRNSTLNTMSFTNSFAAVDKTAVQQFTRGIARVAEQNLKNDPESSLASTGTATENGAGMRLMLDGFNCSSAITQDDLNYIAAGATLPDRIARLEETETGLRQVIDGSWRVDSTLLKLACCRIVPTLRQRNRSPMSPAATPSLVAPHLSRHRPSYRHPPQQSTKQPVLVVHARGIQMDASSPLVSPPANTMRSMPTLPGDFSPTSVSDLHRSGGNDASTVLGSTRSRLAGSTMGTKVHQYEMLALTCNNVDASKTPSSVVIDHTWDLLSTPNAANALSEGKCLFRFLCGSLADLDPETKAIVKAFINLSSFADELTENNAPYVDVDDKEDAAKYIGIHAKTMYMLPGVLLKDITKDLLASTEYERACQPTENKVLECDAEDTFRITVSIIRFIFSLTIQFKVSELTDPAVLQSLAFYDGIVPAKVIMLERTKRQITKVDATAKVRSILMYYPVNDGVLVSNHTIVLNTSLPKVVSKIMNTFGAQGASQAGQTVKQTRQYLLKTFGDVRQKR